MDIKNIIVFGIIAAVVIIAITLYILSKISWNNGVCTTCKGEQFLYVDLNHKGALRHYYKCESCGKERKVYLSFVHE